MKRRQFILGLPVAAIAGPVFADVNLYVTEYRNKIMQLYDAIDLITDDAPLADALRMHGLRKIEWYRNQILLPAFALTTIHKTLNEDPARLIPRFSTPLEKQITAQERRIGEGMIALLQDPDRNLEGLIDAATAQAAIEADFTATTLLFLRMATIARMAGDTTRLNLLQNAAVEMQSFIDKPSQQDKGPTPLQRANMAFAFRGAGFEREAVYFANEYFNMRHAGHDPDSVLCRAIINETKWRKGGMSADTLEYQIRTEIAAVSPEMQVFPYFTSYAKCHYQLLRILAAANADDRLLLWRDEVLAWLDRLEPEKNPLNSRYTLLIAELGRMGRSDLVLSIPYVASGDYLQNWTRDLKPDLEATLQTPMLIAAYAGNTAAASTLAQRLATAFAALPPLPDASMFKQDGHFFRHMPLAALAEAEAHRKRG
ncbi:hypothetical protein [Pseudorhodobacter sp.]|uniref:hypothetical protein n=1 Tax=Pseudorhodobacter sp. TaxID=1934400 RepID=UPI002AFE5C4A|nr:hypothetical protein [Pseudorhodobacter sp.]